MKKTSLNRKTPLTSQSTLKRSPWQRKRSRKAKAKEFSSTIRHIVFDRSNGICERCGTRKIDHLHHAIYRSQQGTGELKNAIGLCIHCHDEAHSSREVRQWCVEMANELAEGNA